MASYGYALHEEVHMDHWCVTREDLGKLRKAVKEGVRLGQITPNERDPFEVEDDKYGPCIHTVVNLLIKPVTYMAGSQSWALMEHAEGLKSDLFITHGWLDLFSWEPS